VGAGSVTTPAGSFFHFWFGDGQPAPAASFKLTTFDVTAWGVDETPMVSVLAATHRDFYSAFAAQAQWDGAQIRPYTAAGGGAYVCGLAPQ
jgi:hypothetical protein